MKVAFQGAGHKRVTLYVVIRDRDRTPATPLARRGRSTRSATRCS